MLRRIILVPSLAALALAAPAGAGTIVVKLTFAPGKLAATAAHVSARAASPVLVPVTIADGRGNGNGWTLRVSAARSVTIAAITARCAANSTCRLPTAAATPAGNVVLRAARGTGMGVIRLVVTVAPLGRGTAATPLSFTIS